MNKYKPRPDYDLETIAKKLKPKGGQPAMIKNLKEHVIPDSLYWQGVNGCKEPDMPIDDGTEPLPPWD